MSALPEEITSARLLFRCGRRTFFVGSEELTCVSGEGNYSRIHLRGGKTFLVRDSITTLDRQLQAYGLRRVHRSHLVRLTEVVEVRRTSRYSMKVLLRDGTAVPLAEAYRRRLEA